MKANSTLSLGLRKIPINLARVLASAPNSCRDAKTEESCLGIQFEYFEYLPPRMMVQWKMGCLQEKFVLFDNKKG